jgi:hypothetical protein
MPARGLLPPKGDADEAASGFELVPALPGPFGVTAAPPGGMEPLSIVAPPGGIAVLGTPFDVVGPPGPVREPVLPGPAVVCASAARAARETMAVAASR